MSFNAGKLVNVCSFVEQLSLEKALKKGNEKIVFFPKLTKDASITWILTEKWKQIPLRVLEEIITGFTEYDYSRIIQIVRKLSLTSDLSDLLEAVTNIERAFNFSRLAAHDSLQQLKIENMQEDLLKIRKALSMLRLNPGDQNLRESLYKLFREVLSKLESSRYTHEFLKSLGTDEKKLMSSYEVTERKNGSTRYIWKGS